MGLFCCSLHIFLRRSVLASTYSILDKSSGWHAACLHPSFHQFVKKRQLLYSDYVQSNFAQATVLRALCTPSTYVLRSTVLILEHSEYSTVHRNNRSTPYDHIRFSDCEKEENSVTGIEGNEIGH
jgi:hypothetical protein